MTVYLDWRVLVDCCCGSEGLVGLGSVSWWCSSSFNIQISLRVAVHDTWLRRNSRQLAIFPMHLFLSYPSVLLPWLPVISALQCLLCQVCWKLILIMVLISSSSCWTVYFPSPLSLSTPSLSLSPNPPCFPHTWTMHYELYFRHTNLLLDIEGCGCVILGVKMRWPSLSRCSLLARSFRSLECPRITHQVYYWVLQMSMFFLFFCWVVEIWQMTDPFTDISYLKIIS